jgi:hypothetical protein
MPGLWAHDLYIQLEASASSGRASARGDTTGHATRYSTGSSFLDPCFWTFRKRYLGVLILVFERFKVLPRYFILILTLRSCSWIVVPGVLAPNVLDLDVTGTGSFRSLLDGLGKNRPLGGFRLPCLTRSCRELWLARYSKGCFVAASMQ